MPVQVKICGLTNLRDARHAAAAGADWLGFVFVPASPRAVTPEQVRAMVRQLPADVPKVGVFVNTAVAEVARILEYCGLDVAQLRGDETAAAVHTLGAARCWKVVALRARDDVTAALAHPAARLLVDTPHGSRRGGTGQVGNWELAAALAVRREIFLAGGLTPANVGRAVQCVRPYGVDVSSGVEAERGRKDPGKVTAFIAAAHEAAAPLARADEDGGDRG